MAIYDRSNIDYSGMIRDMINAKTAGAKIAADNIRRQGELWGNFAKDIGGVASRTWDAAHLNDTDMPGIANYVAFGDSSLLDRQLAEAAARRQMAVQQNFQKDEAMENRKLQEKLALINKTAIEADKMDENMLNRNKAAVKYDYAKSALDAANRTGNVADKTKATLDLALAKHELDYYNNRVNYQEPAVTNPPAPKPNPQGSSEPTPVPEPTPAPEPAPAPIPESNAVAIERYMNTKSFDTNAEQQAMLHEIASSLNWNQDPGLRKAYDHVSAIKSKEQQKLDKEAAAARVKATIDGWKQGDPIPEGFEPDWQDSKPTIRQIQK
jgi:hypothetical protein